MKRSGDLPAGTLTFLFSDIEGSTRHLQDLGPAWTGALDDHHSLMREAIAEHGGTEVVNEGDSFFAVFPTAADAVMAALAAQRSSAPILGPGGAAVRVRMGLHTGSATIAGGSYAGLDVNRAARIMAAAHGGQVLLSEVTRALAATALGEGLTTRDLGEHRLKDLDSTRAPAPAGRRRGCRLTSLRSGPRTPLAPTCPPSRRASSGRERRDRGGLDAARRLPGW